MLWVCFQVPGPGTAAAGSLTALPVLSQLPDLCSSCSWQLLLALAGFTNWASKLSGHAPFLACCNSPISRMWLQWWPWSPKILLLHITTHCSHYYTYHNPWACKKLCHIYSICILWISAHTVFFMLHELQGLQMDGVVDTIKVINTNKPQFFTDAVVI